MKFKFSRDWVHAGVQYKAGDIAELTKAHAEKLKGRAGEPVAESGKKRK